MGRACEPGPAAGGAQAGASPCTTCGACCAYSAEWPRFTCEEEDAIARLPESLVTLSGMRCEGDRCAALSGIVGVATLCTVYADRPDVCRACEPGDDACQMARERYGLGAV
jgi:Fe-S-cluster containining protein